MVASSYKGVEEIGMSDSAKTFLVARIIREPGLGMLNLFEMDWDLNLIKSRPTVLAGEKIIRLQEEK